VYYASDKASLYAPVFEVLVKNSSAEYFVVKDQKVAAGLLSPAAFAGNVLANVTYDDYLKSL
jgi:hypothetical protein